MTWCNTEMETTRAHAGVLTVKGFSCSPELFEKGFPAGMGPCRCASECCEGGVYADVHERDAILAHKDMIMKSMDETQTRDHQRWFETVEQDDPDYASGRCVGTTEIHGKCAFLDGKGRCSIQVACVEHGMHKWALKPLFCILYPVTIEDRTIGVDDMLQGERPCCSVGSVFDVPFFEGCREELEHLVGEEGFRLIQEHYHASRRKEAP